MFKDTSLLHNRNRENISPRDRLATSLKIVRTLICKISPNLPLPKGGINPLWKRGARGDFPNDAYPIMRRLIGSG